MRRLHRVTFLTLSAALCAVMANQAGAGLVSGTYTNGGAPGATWPATAQITSSPKQYQSGVNPSSSPTAQGFALHVSRTTSIVTIDRA